MATVADRAAGDPVDATPPCPPRCPSRVKQIAQEVTQGRHVALRQRGHAPAVVPHPASATTSPSIVDDEVGNAGTPALPRARVTAGGRILPAVRGRLRGDGADPGHPGPGRDRLPAAPPRCRRRTSGSTRHTTCTPGPRCTSRDRAGCGSSPRPAPAPRPSRPTPPQRASSPATRGPVSPPVVGSATSRPSASPCSSPRDQSTTHDVVVGHARAVAGAARRARDRPRAGRHRAGARAGTPLAAHAGAWRAARRTPGPSCATAPSISGWAGRPAGHPTRPATAWPGGSAPSPTGRHRSVHRAVADWRPVPRTHWTGSC